MEHARPLLAASIYGVLIAAQCGCGNQDAAGYRTYTPPAETAANKGSAAEGAASHVADQSEDSLAVTPPVDAGRAAPAQLDADASVDSSVVPAAAESEAVAGASSPATDGANRADDKLLASVGASDVVPAPIEPREPKLLIPDKTFRREGDALRVSYDDIDLLKVLNMEPVPPDAPDHFPDWLKDLEGKRIRLRGYMRPGELSENLPFFVLARDTQACCFGPNTKSYDIIPVVMREGVTTDYIHLRPFDIVGTFHINVEMDLDDPNKVEFLYFIDDAVLIDD